MRWRPEVVDRRRALWWLTSGPFLARAEEAVTPVIPEGLAQVIPSTCRQILLVLSPRRESVAAQMWMMERKGNGARWQRVHGPLEAVLGRNGLAWGCGDLTPSPPKGWPEKREGDGCSPAGVFPITFAFGSDGAPENAWIKLPYRRATLSLRGVDDPTSRYYNQVVDETVVSKDWKSSEDMLRADGLYRWGAFVAHNPKGEPDRGSCIFLHLWKGPQQGTAGCTALPEATLQRVLGWLDPQLDPCLVQTTL